MNMRKQIQKYIWDVGVDKRGVSMIIALALLSVVSVVALTSTYILTNAIRGNTEFGSSIRADAAAEAGINLGLMAVKGSGPGVEVGLRHMCLSLDSNTITMPADGPAINCDYGVEYLVSSSAEDLDPNPSVEVFTIPPIGQGDAGDYCERPVNYKEPFTSSGVEENLKKPCNWNKLAYGESVSIPLYGADSSGNPVNPDALGMGSLSIKVRTPCVEYPYLPNGNLKGPTENVWCKDGGLKGADARPDLEDLTPGPQNDPTDIIVNWQITGYCNYDIDSYDGDCVGTPVPTTAISTNDSDANISAINAGKTSFTLYSILGDGSAGFRNKVFDINTSNLHTPSYPTLLNYLTNPLEIFVQYLDPITTSRDIEEPTLQLSVVSPLTIDSSGNTVPYIEYQIQTDVEIADSFHTAYSTGSIGNFESQLKSKKLNTNTSVEFVIQN